MHEKKKNLTQEWLNVLPQLATRYEISLYRSATSFDIYKDMSTLKQRLQQLIKRMQQASAKRKQEFEEESAKRKQEFKRIEEESAKRIQEIEQRQAERQKEFEQRQQALAQQQEEESTRRQQEAARRQQEIERLQALAHQQRLRVLHNAVTSILQNPNSAHQVLQQQAAAHGLSATLGCVKNAIVAHNAHQQQVKWRQYSEKRARSQARRDVTTNKKRKLREDEKAGMMLPESVFEDEEDLWPLRVFPITSTRTRFYH